MADIIRRGVTLTQALQEAAAIAPLNRVMLYAYELWHPSLAEPIYFVNDVADFAATIEGTADRNPSTEVTFVACPMDLSRPEESDTAESPKITLSRPDVAGLLKEKLDAARGSRVPWVIIERMYASDDTTAPAMLPPLAFELTNVDVSGAAAQIGAQFDDDANVAIPRITFKRSEYPGLQR